MGLFDSMCAESGLIIDDRQRLIPIIETAKGAWAPIALPIAGTNDRGGTMDVPSKLDPNKKAVVALGRTLEYADENVNAAKLDLAGMLDEIRGDGSGATWKTKRVSFALIDGPVFDAIVKAVASSGATAWRRFAQVGLRTPELPLPNRPKVKAARAKPVDPTTRRLCEAILEAPGDDGARKVYVDHLLEQNDPRGKLLSILPAIGKLSFDDLAALAFSEPHASYEANAAKLKPALVELVLFLAWGTRFESARGEGQFFGYGPEDPDDDEYADLQGWAQPYVERARKKYAGMPELLAACDRCEKAFRERGADSE